MIADLIECLIEVRDALEEERHEEMPNKARLRALEAEYEWLKRDINNEIARITEEMARVRAETIDECAEVAEQWGYPEIAAAIRDGKAPEV